MTRMLARISVAVAVMGSAACDPPPTPAPDAPVADVHLISDANADEPTAEERAACANLAMLTPTCSGMSFDEPACLETLVDRRLTLAEPAGCRSEYDAWVECTAGITTCDSGGVPCPDEYGAFGLCVSPRP